eukprot:12886253-Ditylum_brightwellii.AAC.1
MSSTSSNTENVIRSSTTVSGIPLTSPMGEISDSKNGGVVAAVAASSVKNDENDCNSLLGQNVSPHKMAATTQKNTGDAGDDTNRDSASEDDDSDQDEDYEEMDEEDDKDDNASTSTDRTRSSDNDMSYRERQKKAPISEGATTGKIHVGPNHQA